MSAGLRPRLVAVVIIVAGCATPTSSAPSPSPNPASPTSTPAASATTSPAPTLNPTAEPAPDATAEHTDEPEKTDAPSPNIWAQDPPTPILDGAAVRPVVSELNVRERPSTAARRLGTVTPDEVLTVGGPPVEADGYIWYSGVVVSASGELPPLPAMVGGGSGEPLSGWFAASKGTTSYVERMEPRCPTMADLESVVAMLDAERLACFGDDSIELQGTIGCRGCEIHIFGEYEPTWLINPNAVHNLLWVEPMERGSLMLRFPPAGPPEPEQGSILRVRGHFRDGAAASCSIAVAYPWADGFEFHPIGASVARLRCRQEFVVESYRVLGTDPSFG